MIYNFSPIYKTFKILSILIIIAFSNAIFTGCVKKHENKPKKKVSIDNNNHAKYQGKGVNIYILDTGISSHFETFDTRLKSIDNYWKGDFVGDKWGNAYGARDCNGHGTHLAGIVADRHFGIAKKANIFPLRVIDCEGKGQPENLIAAVEWLNENALKPAVALMSLNYGNNQNINDAVNYSASRGIVYVASSGNGHYEDACKASPGGAYGAISVGGIMKDNYPLIMNNWGRCIDLFAPGENIYSLSFNSGLLISKTGSSMAAAFVAGSAAIVLSQYPDADSKEVKDIIINCNTDNSVKLYSGDIKRRTTDRMLVIK